MTQNSTKRGIVIFHSIFRFIWSGSSWPTWFVLFCVLKGKEDKINQPDKLAVRLDHDSLNTVIKLTFVDLLSRKQLNNNIDDIHISITSFLEEYETLFWINSLYRLSPWATKTCHDCTCHDLPQVPQKLEEGFFQKRKTEKNYYLTNCRWFF